MDSRQRPADFTIYRTKVALKLTLKRGTPRSVPGRNGKTYTATDPGVLFLQVAQAIGERRYDWENKVTLGLDEHEVGQLLAALEGQFQKFYHDPNKGKEREGQEGKTLTISPSEDRSKIFINVSYKVNDETTKFPGVSISLADARTIQCLCQRAVPEILGW